MADLTVVSDRAIPVSNKEFLEAIFGDEWEKAHVTSFFDDPSNIPENRRSLCWGGRQAGDLLQRMDKLENQYFTISLFTPLDNGRAVRRKNHFDACFVIVADDVGEKLPKEEVEKLPIPTYKLYTSQDSEQWGWAIDPCENREWVENLLDGLVAQGLAPDGTDPGMKGVTRYVRLPEGSNTKAKRFIEGKPFDCYIHQWNPDFIYTIDTLAKVFHIDIYKPRGENDTETLALDNPIALNHPIMKHVNITGVGNDGWLRIDCLNSITHSDGDASGAAIRITADGGVQYQCHHGHCNGEGRAGKFTGAKALELIDEQMGGDKSFLKEVATYKADIAIMGTRKLVEETELNFPVEAAVPTGGEMEPANVTEEEEEEEEEAGALDPLRYIFVAPENAFYDTQTGLMITPKGLDNRYLRQFPGGKLGPTASKLLLQTLDKSISDADGIGWKPETIYPPRRADIIFEDEGRRLINTWRGFALTPVTGDVTPWLSHAEYLIPDAREREVVLDYLAFCVQRVGEKPAFCIVHRGSHRTGKDLFYSGVVQAMGSRCAHTVDIDNVLAGWGDYLKGLKLAIITEVDKAQDHRVANAMKTVVAPTASGKRVLNLKGGKVTTQLDCMASIMMSNKRACMAIEEGDRRYFVADSWIAPMDAEYYRGMQDWYHNHQGYAKVLGYLLTRDLSKFDHMALPFMTDGALEMVKSGRHDYEQDLEMLIHDKVPPFHVDAVTVQEFKKARREHGLKGGNNGSEEAMERLGWIKFTYNVVKEEGKTVRVPAFWGKGLAKDATPREVFDFFNSQVGNKI